MKITEKIHLLEEKIGFIFKEKSYLIQALTHKSAYHKHNERLEFLGDAILSFMIAELLYQQFPLATEGELTRARASLVNKTTLSQLAQEYAVGEYLLLGIGEKRSGGFRRESILADAFEAIIGAVYLDAGVDQCYECVRRWFASRLQTLKPQDQEKDPKTRLQEWLQANQKSLPKYEVIATEGEPHSQVFTVTCEVGDFLKVEGVGVSRRLAEQMAARKILERINEFR